MTKSADAARVIILLAVRNGARFLQPQLDSFVAQEFQSWDLLAGDDGSTDDSAEILCAFSRQIKDHKVTLVEGPRRGTSSVHFLTLLEQAPEADWLAFSDQDDIWRPEKLARAVKALETVDATQPALYCSSTWVTDINLGNARLSRIPKRALGFHNAVLQNVAAGNTIVLNRAAQKIVRQTVSATLALPNIPAHDWWLYQMVTGAGGQVIYDKTPSLYYRQHDQNQVGASFGFQAAVMRVWGLLNGQYRDWNTANIAALFLAKELLSPENRNLLRQFSALRNKGFLGRIRCFYNLGLYRQTRLTQAAMWLAVILHRI